MESGKYWEAIKNWHKKAKEEEDFFIKFILEYISFIAFLNQIEPGCKDRKLIQKLKRNKTLKKKYLDQVDKGIIKNLIKELELEPIKNVTNHNDKRWDCDTERQLDAVSKNDGKLRSVDDFTNIIEFIYRARNNLFHGKKGLNYERDLIIVKYGYKLLNPLMEVVLKLENFKSILLYENNAEIIFTNHNCPHCKKNFTTKHGLQQHISTKHPIKTQG